MSIRQKNEQEHLEYEKNIEELGKSMKQATNIKDQMKNNNKTTEASDSQPIVKLRLRNLLFRNKEKIKIAEMYKKNMEKI